MDLDQELNNFLRASATISELVSDALLERISIRSPLQDRLEVHLGVGGSLILSGTAGSGKTHLVRALGRSVDLTGHKVCEDLASVPIDTWETLGTFAAPTILAANEGALLDAAERTTSATIFAEAARTLREMQVGSVSDTPPRYLLVDMAAADASASDALEKVLELPFLLDYANARLSQEQARAWALLQDGVVRTRLASLVTAAAVASDSGGFTFRQLWQFVGDLLIGGESNAPWQHGVFFGKSKVSQSIRSTYPLQSLSLPRVASKLWYRDINSLSTLVSEAALEVLWDYESSEGPEAFKVLASIAAFSLYDSPIEPVLKAPRDLWAALYTQLDAGELVRALNRYLTYGLRTAGVDLELWVPTDLERRSNKPEAQVSLGTVPGSAFEISRNLIFSEPSSDESALLRGTRLSLLHRPSNASLSLTRDLVSAISGTRSHRVSDRSAVEFDWRIFRFIDRVATCTATATQLQAVRFDFDQRTSRTAKFQLGESRIVGESL